MFQRQTFYVRLTTSNRIQTLDFSSNIDIKYCYHALCAHAIIKKVGAYVRNVLQVVVRESYDEPEFGDGDDLWWRQWVAPNTIPKSIQSINEHITVALNWFRYPGTDAFPSLVQLVKTQNIHHNSGPVITVKCMGNSMIAMLFSDWNCEFSARVHAYSDRTFDVRRMYAR